MPHPDPDAGPPPPDPMTYRPGAYVIDIPTGTLVQVMGSVGPRVQVRRPWGGREREVVPEALRPASRAERDGAGIHDEDSTSPVGCDSCAALRAAHRQARSGGDAELTEEATAALRGHFRRAHLLPEVNAW
ncbi:hypothetical protein [Streptomyces stramineus]